MAITFFGSASSPADNGAAAGPGPTAITPPASMTLNDLVLVFLQYRATGVALSFDVSQTGGQEWAELYIDLDGTNISVALWACRFNGTWSADPSFVADSTLGFTIVMDVYRPTSTSKIIDQDVAAVNGSFVAGTTPFTKTITQITTRNANAMAIAYWASTDDNTWGSLTGGWTNPGGVTQIRNTTGSDQSMTRAYQLFASPGATGNVSMNQATLGGDAGRTCIIAFYERDDPAAGIPPVDMYQGFEDAADGTTITTTILDNADHLSGSPGSWTMINSGGTTNLTIETDAEKNFTGSRKVSVGGTTYDDVGSTRGMAQDHSTQGTFSHAIQFDLAAPQNAGSCGFFWKSSIAYQSVNFSITLTQFVDGGFAGMSAFGMIFSRPTWHSAHSENVLSEGQYYARIFKDTWYWITQYYNDSENVGKVAIYDPATWKQVGFTGVLRLGSAPGNLAAFLLGQNGGGLDSQTGITLFDDMMLDLTNAVFPLLPGAAPAGGALLLRHNPMAHLLVR